MFFSKKYNNRYYKIKIYLFLFDLKTKNSFQIKKSDIASLLIFLDVNIVTAMFSSSVLWLRTLSRKPSMVTRAFSRTSCLCDHDTNLTKNETTIQQQKKRRSYKTMR